MVLALLALVAAASDRGSDVSAEASMATAEYDSPTCRESHLTVMAPADEPRSISVFSTDRRPLVMASIAGGPYMPFVLDFGSASNLISLRVAEQLALPNNGPSRSVDGTGDPVPGFDTCLNDLVVGGVPVPDQGATAYPIEEPGDEGIIGPLQFRGSIVKFDGPNHELVLLEEGFDRNSLSQPLAWIGPSYDPHPVATISANGYTFDAKLDTGNTSALILPMEWIDKLELDREPVVVGSARTAAGVTHPVYRATILGTTKIGSQTFENLRALFMPTDTPLIGWPLIKDMVFYMDPAARITWFELNEAED